MDLKERHFARPFDGEVGDGGCSGDGKREVAHATAESSD